MGLKFKTMSGPQVDAVYTTMSYLIVLVTLSIAGSVRGMGLFYTTEAWWLLFAAAMINALLVASHALWNYGRVDHIDIIDLPSWMTACAWVGWYMSLVCSVFIITVAQRTVIPFDNRPVFGLLFTEKQASALWVDWVHSIIVGNQAAFVTCRLVLAEYLYVKVMKPASFHTHVWSVPARVAAIGWYNVEELLRYALDFMDEEREKHVAQQTEVLRAAGAFKDDKQD